jgi:PAS domain S-box-containing protein
MKKALIVDDKEQNLYLLQTMLKNYGYDVLTASNGARALEQARRVPPDIVISDILMPVMDGFAFCREWQKDKRLQKVPFVFYTATYTDPRDEELALSLGAACFVVKPQDPAALVAILRQIIEERETGGPSAPAQPAPEETGYYKMYSEALVRKLEDKMLALEGINRVLDESEKKYRLLAENVQDVIFVLDMDLKYTYVSPSVKALRGYEPEEVMAQQATGTLTPASMDLALKTLTEGLALEETGQGDLKRSWILELEVWRRDGSTVWTEMRFSFIRDEKNRPTGILGVTREITERKKAWERVRDRERRLNEAQSIAHVGSWELNIPTNELIWSDEIYHLFDLDPKVFNATYEGFLKAIHPDDREFVDNAYTNSVKNRAPYDIVHRLLMTDGSVKYVRERCETYYDKKGNPIRSTGTVQDITEQKQTEEQLQQTLESLRNALNTTIQVMVSAVEIRDPYTAGHQMRVASLAHAIAAEMGLPQEKIDGVCMVGTIHDIGKLSIPAEILSKPTKLTEIEFSLIKEHARRGFEMLKDVESPWPLAEIVHQHHERINGSGYPRHLKGEEIHIEARILAVADTVEAMASHRPYRAGLGIDAALEEIETNKGTLYDADAADACQRLFREKRYELPQG